MGIKVPQPLGKEVNSDLQRPVHGWPGGAQAWTLGPGKPGFGYYLATSLFWLQCTAPVNKMRMTRTSQCGYKH